ncbi:Xaa-Pro aminopeptidase [Polymorphobacter glacialis]|uniref:Xaa-Pro aminopeptidase n=1 Tax=Sandarakinorhabdus glacialis TaxID=1614636 RepID=A0A917E6T4_9SPHN|nr:M24 family metallopeptidase [Polymorphobacter glacialis]GGE09924.1 Xaa-Pro aminopeptidase [Polymorphobacter glacialis]
MCQTEPADPAFPVIMPLRDRAALENIWLKQRLDTIVPALMRENQIDMWVMVAREYLEDPVVATMLDGTSFSARRRTILVFYDPGAGKAVERFTVSRYGLSGLFDPAWNPEEQPDQWKALADIIKARNPKRIALNVSAMSAFSDGLTASQREGILTALPAEYQTRIVPADKLAIGWLETRTPAEMAVYPQIVRTAHAIIAEGFSPKVITPGKTTTADVVWWYRERIAGLKLATWFQPSVSISRAGTKSTLDGDTVIQPGDMLWTDFGIKYLRLNTDTQHMGYVLKPGETDAPAGLKAGLAAANGVQDALTSSYKVGATGNQVLAAARAKAIAAGLEPSIYSHPLGYHGHAAGTPIGMWDNQAPRLEGEYVMRPNTAWSIELQASHKVPEWNNQEVGFKLEEDAFFDGKSVQYIDGRQTKFHLIGRQMNPTTSCE